jgi:chemotaxis protein methyltransferase CheR
MADIELKPEEFALFQNYIYKKVGISLSNEKTTLVKSRLMKRVNALGLGSFRAYYDYLIHDRSGDELTFFVSAIATNLTYFFREPAQWVWLEQNIARIIASKKEKKLRIWSAGCSSGEEPYSILMFLQEHLKDFDKWDIKILATDISSKILTKAMAGIYEEKTIESLSKTQLINSFSKVRNENGISFHILPHLREKVLFRLYNIVTDPFFLKNKFDMIFCRNVMIYFDAPTRLEVIERFGTLLPKGSPFFMGSSESLTAKSNSFKLIGSSIYEKL